MRDTTVVLRVCEGKRPTRPPYDLHALGDGVWGLIEACWAAQPEERPSTSQIVDRLCVLSEHTVDRGQLPDGFDYSFPSRMLYAQAEHTLSVLSAALGQFKSLVRSSEPLVRISSILIGKLD